MNFMDSWNEIVSQYNENFDCKEEIVQKSWEMLLKWLFRYAREDIDAQRSIKMGATERGEPDIIAKKNEEDLFVIELKRHTLHDGRDQLFSYLNQLKMNIGIVVCNCLYLYDYDFTKKDVYSELEIPFTQNNPDGEAFVELFCKQNFDKQKISDFIKSKNQTNSNVSSIQDAVTTDLIKNLLKTHFSKQYPVGDVEEALSDVYITFGTSAENLYSQDSVEIPKDGKVTVTIKSTKIPIYRSSSLSVQDFVKQTLKTLFSKNLLSSEEIKNLQEEDYCKKTFSLQFPLLQKDWNKCAFGSKEKGKTHIRYWRNFRVGGFYVCSQWWKAHFSEYERKIALWLIKLEEQTPNE